MLTLYPSERRVVITGLGVISPIGCDKNSFWDSLANGKSGITRLEADSQEGIAAGQVHDFTGHIKDFGDLDGDLKKKLRKALKIMNRETRMGLASALQALEDSSVAEAGYEPDRFGVSFGASYVSMLPEDFETGVKSCTSEDQEFDIERWGKDGLKQVAPLWILKCLPNMPACHIAIYGNMQGPNNSITQGEASANIAIAEATRIIQDGDADVMLVGGTGDTLLPFSRMHSMLEQDVATCGEEENPAELCKPFDKSRKGTALGEGSAAFILEEYETAKERGAMIYGEVIGSGSSCVVSPNRVPDRQTAMKNALSLTLEEAKITPQEVTQLHAHGLSTQTSDREEAAAIQEVFGEQTGSVPVVAAKSYFGNASGGVGALELAASLLAMRAGTLFPTLNLEEQDEQCPLSVVQSHTVPAGDLFLNLNVVPQGQASCLAVRKVA